MGKVGERYEVRCEVCEVPKTRCTIEALLTVDERGQVLLPKELREKADIKAGDKLVAVTCSREGEVCCITLMPSRKLAESIRQFLGPFLKEIIEAQ